MPSASLALRKSTNRLSSIFSNSSSNSGSQPSTSSIAADSQSELSSSHLPEPAAPPGKIIKRLSRLTGGNLSTSQLPTGVAYPTPTRPEAALSSPSITPVPLESIDSSDTLQPPPPILSGSHSRPSSPIRSRRNSHTSSRSRDSSRPVTPNPDGSSAVITKKKRRSIFGHSQLVLPSDDSTDIGRPLAWVVGHQGKPPYNLSILLGAEKVPELWDENGDTYVYLFPKESGKGPSFRIDSATYAESLVLTKMAYGGIYSSNAASTAESRDASIDLITTNLDQDVPAPSRSPPPLPSKSPPPIGGSSSDGTQDSRTFSVESIQGPIHLYLRLKLSTDNAVPGGVEPKPNTQDADTLVGIRNLFAFLAGQSLVATENCPSVFNIFLRISDLLHSYGFSNIDGSTFGECAASSFDSYVDELQLGDMTKSREKTIEGIILGEKMRSVLLYNEAFVHGVGRYEDIQALNSPKWSIITPITRNRLERASLDLEVRLRNIHTKLSDFDFPSIFSGIMNSKEAEEGKLVHFEAWRNAFNAMRKFVLSYYKQQFGAWPPKATSKKNDLETSGLNRLVLKRLYHDFSDLYDLLVDRTSLTARTADGPLIDEAEATINLADLPYQQALVRALRSVLSEYDRATPPVQPPMPYDTPIFPPTSNQKTLVDKKKDAKQRSKKLNSDDLDRTLDASYNSDGITSNPFVAAFRDFERKINHNKSYDDIISNRMGQWLFLYAVLQSLPMVVVDAPAIKWTHGVEYFLCEPPRAGVPWAKEDTGVARSWYGIAGGSKVVSLPSDLVEHGVEGIYRRSHCWKMAEKWSGHGGILEAARHESIADALPAPPGMRLDSISSSRDTSPSRRNMESVMNLGLEQLPIPGQIAPSGSPALRPAPTHNDPTKTFDAILGLSEPVSHQKKKR